MQSSIPTMSVPKMHWLLKKVQLSLYVLRDKEILLPEMEQNLTEDLQPWIIGQAKCLLFVKGTVEALDLTLQLSPTRVITARFINQNEQKKDGMGRFTKHALMAQSGVRITWMIDLPGNVWQGKIQDGVFIPNETRLVSHA